ncbi:uncharacterized protein LOC143692283 [Agelaius phoeniceus]|uniref:uncharacterized protein LOC143692283 n=1 Tax=Agelaius phoeniceus TaxID=39638 RepID=UPI004054AC0D
MAAPLSGMLPGPASNSCGRLVTRPPPIPPPRAAPPGEAGRRRRRDPGGSPWAAGPVLGPPGTAGPASPDTAGPASPGTGCRGTPRTEPDSALSSGLSLRGRRVRAVAPPWLQSAGRIWGSSCTAVGREGKEPRCLRETRSSDPHPSRGAG